MSIIKSIGRAVKGVFKAAVPALLAWGKTEGEKALAALRNSDTGAKIFALVKAADASGKSGPEKLADVLEAAKPLLLDLATKEGRQADLADVETIGRTLIESFVLDLRKGDVLKAILVALGVKA